MFKKNKIVAVFIGFIVLILGISFVVYLAKNKIIYTDAPKLDRNVTENKTK